jgi:ribosomal protein L37AE/L43A
MYLSWVCDFCRKTMLVVSAAGIIYCENCKKSYGQVLWNKAEGTKLEDENHG